MNFVTLSVVLSAFVCCAASKALPSFIEACSINNIDECFVKHANLAIPHMLNGNKDLKLTSFNPLIVNEVVFAPSDSLKIDFTNLKITGFDEAKVVDAHLDKSAQSISFTIEIPKLSIKSEYNAKGKILILPIEGEGPSQMQLIKPKFTIQTKMDNFNAESTENIKIKDVSVDYKVEKSTYNFENLFGGNKKLGDDLNKFLNENEAEIQTDFSPIISQIIQQIVKNIMGQLLGNLNYKDVILA